MKEPRNTLAGPACYEDEFVTYLLGELDQEKRAEIHSHLKACERCRYEIIVTRDALDTSKALTEEQLTAMAESRARLAALVEPISAAEELGLEEIGDRVRVKLFRDLPDLSKGAPLDKDADKLDAPTVSALEEAKALLQAFITFQLPGEAEHFDAVWQMMETRNLLGHFHPVSEPEPDFEMGFVPAVVEGATLPALIGVFSNILFAVLNQGVPLETAVRVNREEGERVLSRIAKMPAEECSRLFQEFVLFLVPKLHREENDKR